VLKRHYPDFEQLLNAIPDHRQRRTYEVAEILSAGLIMFVLRCESRHQADQLAGQQLESNYLRIFGMRLPIMDTVHVFLVNLDSGELEKLRELLLRRLMERKVFDKQKYKGYYNISFDGTGVHTFSKEPFVGCPYKETKNGIKWYLSVLEAKLVCANGFSISVGSEWLVNQNGKFNKQDCEQAAFKRLSAKIKANYPRLAILVSADGLYCSDPMFGIIASYDWKMIFTFKDQSLKSLWKTIRKMQLSTKELVIKKLPSGDWLTDKYEWINGLTYKTHKLNFVSYQRFEGKLLKERHVHLTNLNIDPQEVAEVSLQGRLRWKIENQGFNTQKNLGFGLGHKYARKKFNAIKNYYLLMQIAHLISQLAEKLQSFRQGMEEAQRTFQHVIADVIADLGKLTCSLKDIHQYYLKIKQLRY